ncbi:MAG: APC family permease [Chthonomonas sp.]|nr:APC family permease [Chthonomonas sp.]
MGVLNKFKRALFGRPIHTKRAQHERLPKRIALPVFASDALSSVAYATEEIMHVLGLALLGATFNISIFIVLLVVLVAFSYRQTIYAYPDGGGSYRVSKENLGRWPGMIAGGALLIDYVLTVAVSVSAGVLAIVSMAPQAAPYIIQLNLFFVLMLTLINLRGAKESGAVFAIPTYTFIGLIFVTIGIGLTKPAAEMPQVLLNAKNDQSIHQTLGVFLILKAFSSGCTALTGIEAISDGITAFKEPTSRNAAKTLGAMATILVLMFVGMSFLGNKFHAYPMEAGPGFKTVTAQIAAYVYGDRSIGFTAIQVATAAILVLAANTAFADFPRLANQIAKDDLLPRQFGTLGDRLVFKNGIVALGVAASILLVIFKGDTHHLIPLYAIGVFMCFTLSQFGMVQKNRKEGKPIYLWIMSVIGGIVTLVVTGVIAVTKWSDGGYIVPIAMTIMIAIFLGVNKHYRYLGKQLSVEPTDQVPNVKSTTLLLVPRVHKGILQAIGYAKSTAKDCRALHVTLNPKSTGDLKKEWDQHGGDIPLVILESPYRSLVGPVISYIDQALEEDPTMIITVIVPQAVPKHWWHSFLHNNIAVPLKIALAGRRNVVITNIRYFLN